MGGKYTAQMMREYAAAMADDLIDSNHNPGEMIYDSGIVIIECLRQAADDKERLEAVVKECEKIVFDRELKHQGAYFFVEIDGKRIPVLQSAICETVNGVPAILRLARGDGGAE